MYSQLGMLTRLKRRKDMSTALLLVDELGFEPMSRQEASLFFRLVSYRYGRGAILITITTNKGIRDWTELLAATRFSPRPSSPACCSALMNTPDEGAS